MLKNILLFTFLIFVIFKISAQKLLPFQPEKIKETTDFFVDDYGNFYLYKKQNFTITKYDSLGNQLGRQLMTVPFKIQNVQNPLNLFLFSQNSQEIKFLDQNLNEIQKLPLQSFGFIKAIYSEDLQQIWLLDDSEKRLIQYNYRDKKILHSYPFFMDYEAVEDILVFENKLYILGENFFSVRNFKNEKLFEYTIKNGKKLRRENDKIFIIQKNKIAVFQDNTLQENIFNGNENTIVEKNSNCFFELNQDNFYLYKIQN